MTHPDLGGDPEGDVVEGRDKSPGARPLTTGRCRPTFGGSRRLGHTRRGLRPDGRCLRVKFDGDGNPRETLLPYVPLRTVLRRTRNPVHFLYRRRPPPPPPRSRPGTRPGGTVGLYVSFFVAPNFTPVLSEPHLPDEVLSSSPRPFSSPWASLPEVGPPVLPVRGRVDVH